MPRYFFNVFDGSDLVDRDGTELPNHVFARREAIRFAGSLIESDGARDKLGEEWRMEVTDEAGLILFRLDFTVQEAAAITGTKDREA